MAPMVYSRTLEKLIHEENLKSKISRESPFKGAVRPDEIGLKVVSVEGPR
jgi:hypothetical protein